MWDFDTSGSLPDMRGEPILPDRPRPADYDSLRRRIDRYELIPELLFCLDESRGPFVALERDINAAAALGIPILLCFAPSPSPKFASQRIGEMAWFHQVESWFAGVGPLIRWAERHNITLVVKPHGGIAGTGEDLSMIVDRLGSPAVRVCYDPGNVIYYEGIRPEHDLPSVVNLVRAMCIKDHRGGQGEENFPTPGTGDIDRKAIFSMLRDARFAGPCLVERIDGLTSPEDVDAALLRAQSYLADIVVATGSSE